MKYYNIQNHIVINTNVNDLKVYTMLVFGGKLPHLRLYIFLANVRSDRVYNG